MYSPGAHSAQPHSNGMRSQLDTTELSCKWRITNYSQHGKAVGESITETFTIYNKSNVTNKWVIELFPNGNCEQDKEFVGIFLRPHQENTLPAVASIGIYLENEKKERSNGHEFSEPVRFDDFDWGWGWSTFISHSKLFNPKYNFLPGNVLTIGIKISTSPEEPSNFQITEPQLAKDLGKLLSQKTHADVIFICKGKEVQAHKSILSIRSDVFRSMFDQDYYYENMISTVDIGDMSPAALEGMLQFIYTDKCDKLKENAEELFAAANKYGLEGLKEISEKSLGVNLCVENAARVFRLADLHRTNRLKARAVDFISRNMNEIIETEGWKMLKDVCSRVIVEEIMERSNKRSKYK